MSAETNSSRYGSDARSRRQQEDYNALGARSVFKFVITRFMPNRVQKQEDVTANFPCYLKSVPCYREICSLLFEYQFQARISHEAQ